MRVSALPRPASLLAALCFACAALPAVASETVELKLASEAALPDRQQASAAVLAPNDAVIAAEIAAIVAAVEVDAGRSVAKGDVLVRLDERDARLALAQADAQRQAAQARLTLATQRAERGRELRGNAYISEDELLALETGRDAARAELALARAGRDAAARQLDKCLVRAPFEGVVLERMAQVGALAMTGTPLLRLVSVQAPEAEAQVAQEAAADLALAREIVFQSQGKRYPLTLAALSPVLERSTRTQLARFTFSAEAAPAGSIGQVSWVGPRLLLPAELMVKRGGRLGVFVDEAGRARFVPASDAQEGRPFRVELSPSVRVVSRGQQGLNEGDALNFADSAELESAPTRAEPADARR
jgi:RND family efflux transporter MFP subunit